MQPLSSHRLYLDVDMPTGIK